MKSLVFAVCAACLLSFNALAAERVLDVTASAEVEIPATIAEVRMGIESTPRSSAIDAQNIVKSVAQDILNFLKEKQVSNISTDSIRLQQRLVQLGEGVSRTVYLAENILTFRHDPEQIGLIIDQVMGLGATRIDSVHSFASAEARNTARNEAIKIAAVRAKVHLRVTY